MLRKKKSKMYLKVATLKFNVATLAFYALCNVATLVKRKKICSLERPDIEEKFLGHFLEHYNVDPNVVTLPQTSQCCLVFMPITTIFS